MTTVLQCGPGTTICISYTVYIRSKRSERGPMLAERRVQTRNAALRVYIIPFWLPNTYIFYKIVAASTRGSGLNSPLMMNRYPPSMIMGFDIVLLQWPFRKKLFWSYNSHIWMILCFIGVTDSIWFDHDGFGVIWTGHSYPVTLMLLEFVRRGRLVYYFGRSIRLWIVFWILIFWIRSWIHWCTALLMICGL